MSSEENTTVPPVADVKVNASAPQQVEAPKHLSNQTEYYQQFQQNNYQGKPHNNQKPYNPNFNPNYNPNYNKAGGKKYYEGANQYNQPVGYYPGIPQTLPEKPLLASPVKKHTPIVIKTKTGVPVDLQTRRLSFNAESSAPTGLLKQTTAPVIPASATQESAPVAAQPAANTVDDKKLKQQAFMEMIKQKAAAKKRAKEEAAGLSIPEEPKVEETKVEEPKVEEPKVEEPVAEPVAETKVEETKVEETKVEEPVAEAKVEESKVEETKAEESVAETKTEEATEETNTEEPVAESKVEEPVVEDNRPSMSHFFEQITAATEIEDPFTFKYSEGVEGPDPSCKSESVKRYNPVFLLQFDKLDYKIDDVWRANYVSKIYIPDKSESRDRSMRGKDSRSRSNGPMRGINLRNDLDGRNNSRSGSKRKGRDGRDSRDKSRRGDRDPSRKSRGGREREEKDDKPVIVVAPEDAKLEKAVNRWVPKSQKTVEKEVKYAPDGKTVIYDQEDLEKKIRSLLNKLSLEKFDAIGDELIALANQSKWESNAESLKATVRLTFAKATDEPHWSQMYAKFCQKLVKEIDPEVLSEDSPLPTPTEEDKYFSGTRLAYRLLVSRCQTEYEKGWSIDLPVNENGTPIEPELMSDEYYELAAQKRRGLGLVRFIGELYRLNLIKSHVIVGCIKKLTHDTRENAPVDQPYLPQEDTLETIHQFLLTVGEKLEKEIPQCIKFAFDEIAKYMENEAIPSRLRFKFLDLIDLRNASWRDANAKLAGPKTISEIHAEFNNKQQQQQQQATQERRERSMKRDRPIKSRWNNEISSNDISKVGIIRKSGDNSISALRRGAPSANATKDEFTTVGSPRSKSSRGGAPALSRSSSNVSVSAAAEESESRQQSTNSFAALMGGDDTDSDEDDDEEAEEEEEEIADDATAEEENEEEEEVKEE